MKNFKKLTKKFSIDQFRKRKKKRTKMRKNLP